MLTEIDAIKSARTQYRAAFRQMAISCARWHIYRGSAGVVLDMAGADMPVLVEDVQGKAEETMVNALSHALRKGSSV